MRYVELSVGTFMVMGIIALVLMAFRVSGLSMDTSGETYTLKARFQNLGGLTVDGLRASYLKVTSHDL